MYEMQLKLKALAIYCFPVKLFWQMPQLSSQNDIAVVWIRDKQISIPYVTTSKQCDQMLE